MLTRRQFARGLALTAVGLLVPAPLVAAAQEPTRRLWALDGSMLGAGPRLGSALITISADMRELDTAMRFADAATRAMSTLDAGIRALEAVSHDWERTKALALALGQGVNSGPVYDFGIRPTSYTRTYRRRLAA